MQKFDKAVVESVLFTENSGNFVTKAADEVNLDYGGIPGDRHFGLTKKSGVRESMYPRGTEIFNRRQLTIVSLEECAAIAKRLEIEKVLPEWLGANITLSGFPHLTQLPAGSRILFPSGAGVLCEGENLPCIYPGEVIQSMYENERELASRFVKAGYGRRGIIGVVERPGRITAGDAARVIVIHPKE